MQHVLDGGAHEHRLIEIDLQLHPLGRGGLDDGQLLARALHHRERAGIGLLQDREVGGATPVDPHHVVLDCVTVAHARDVAQRDGGAIHRLHRQVVERLHRVGAGIELHVVLGPADLRGSRGHQHVAREHRLHHVVR